MSYVDNHDDVVAFMITPKGDTIPMVPNNAYYAGVVGGQVTYTDHHGGIYKTAQKAAEAKVGQEDGTNIITKGNCGEGTAPVPNWVPEKKAQGVASQQNDDIAKSGVIFDATLRDKIPTGGKLEENDGVKLGHTTQWYDDKYHVSWNNPGQENVHWTNQEAETHEPPSDANRGNDPKPE